MKALLIVDVQNDYCPGGAVAVPEGDKVVPIINRLMDLFPLVIATKDWHLKNSVHFEKWPSHCVQNTPGADFHPGLKTAPLKKIFLKGTKNKDDGYSAFEATNENLEKFLRKEWVTDLYIVGLATDYCVKASALDADKRGFETFVVEDAVAAVNKKEGDGAKALKAMSHAGITLIDSSEVSAEN
jgi:nicotinamidase/pyrazinamidase